MKVIAYQCENCSGIFMVFEIVCLIPKTPDLFNRKIEYECNDNPEKSNIHFCIGCYNKHVIELLKGINRKTEQGEKDYQYHYRLYSTKFYVTIHNKYLLRSNATDRKKKALLQPLGKTTPRK